jgi:hypothetical protein
VLDRQTDCLEIALIWIVFAKACAESEHEAQKDVEFEVVNDGPERHRKTIRCQAPERRDATGRTCPLYIALSAYSIALHVNHPIALPIHATQNKTSAQASH